MGQFAIQLLRLSGYKIVTTASPRNFELIKSLGADAVFDYRDPEVVSKIKAATGDSITNVLDAISVKDTQRISAASVAPSGGKVVLVLRRPPGVTDRKDVDFHGACLGPGLSLVLSSGRPSFSAETVIYTALGRAFAWPWADYPVSDEDRAHMVQFLKKVPVLLKDGSIKPVPVKLWEGGLGAIPDGLQYMREGKVSAEKIVYRV